MLRRMASSQELHITLAYKNNSIHIISGIPSGSPSSERAEWGFHVHKILLIPSIHIQHGYYELHHIGGPTAKVTQEADNVLVIQRRRDIDDRRKFRKFLYVSFAWRWGFNSSCSLFKDSEKPFWWTLLGSGSGNNLLAGSTKNCIPFLDWNAFPTFNANSLVGGSGQMITSISRNVHKENNQIFVFHQIPNNFPIFSIILFNNVVNKLQSNSAFNVCSRLCFLFG